MISREETLALLARFSSIVVTTHVNPDGDAIGSAAALARHFLAQGKSASVLSTSAVPENLTFLNTDDLIRCYDPGLHRDLLRTADAVIIVDVNQSGRLRTMEADVLASAARKLVIDHHLLPQPFADGYYIVQEAGSTAEILYDLITAGSDAPLSPEIATALYVGIMTDTGSFRFERTTPEVHRIAARLLEAGVDPTLVYRRVHDEYPVGRTLLLGRILSRLQPIAEGKATVLSVSLRDFAETSTGVEDVENLSNYGLMIRDVDATAFVVELPDAVKISFRSRGDISVHEVARAMGGGGHRFAAGASINGRSLDDVCNEVAQRLTGLVLGSGERRTDSAAS